MPVFIPGQQLSEAFYWEVVRPILASAFPDLVHSAALIGYGSDVLGYDTSRSTDHEWGPRLLLFIPEAEFHCLRPRILDTLADHLPFTFRGFSTHFGNTEEEGIRTLRETWSHPISHKIEVLTVRGFFQRWTGLDPTRDPSVVDWLITPEQRLLEVTAGRVFHDGLGQLEKIRARLAYYPRDVWLLLLAAQWRRIGQQEAFVGRTGEVGDERGSRLIGSALVRDLMRLGFMMERKYAPYSKWFGTAFARLGCAESLGPVLDAVLAASSWTERERHLSRAYEIVAGLHNQLAITPPLDVKVAPYWGRPFQVIRADRFTRAIEAAIADPEVRSLQARFGSIDQVSDSTDVLSDPSVYSRLRAIYRDPRS